MIYLTPAQILFLHARLVAETGGTPGIRDLGMLAAAVARPQATFDGRDLYPDLVRKAAALMESIILNHPFIDGNKRTGVATAGLFLLLNGRRLTASNDELEQFTLGVARGETHLDTISAWVGSTASRNMDDTLQKRIHMLVSQVFEAGSGAWLVWCDPHGHWSPLLKRVAGMLATLAPEDQTRAAQSTLTLDESRAILDRAGGKPLSGIILEMRGPKA